MIPTRLLRKTDMPTYDYLCEACGHRTEIFQAMSDKPKRSCPECKSRKFKRLIGSGAGVIFKGSGFYETDYRSNSYKDEAKKDTESGSCDNNPGPCSTPGCPKDD